MVTASNVGFLGTITLYDNGTDVWEVGGGNYGLAGPGQAGPGASLSGYAGSVEGTVGQLTGALDMQGLARSCGRLRWVGRSRGTTGARGLFRVRRETQREYLGGMRASDRNDDQVAGDGEPSVH
jgi:hypothetical protein